MNQTQAIGAMSRREDFTASALSGANVSGVWESGRLSGEDYARFREDQRDITYVVRSYATPIAWIKRDGTVHIVSQRFSVTTSKHKGYVRRALA